MKLLSVFILSIILCNVHAQLTITSGAVFDCNTTLTLKDINIVNNGTFNVGNNSLVNFSGVTTGKGITGASSLPAFYDFAINNPNGFYINNNFVIQHNLNIANGFIHLNDHSLSLNGNFLGSGTISSTSLSSLIIGGNAGILYFTPSANTIKTFTISTSSSATLGNALNVTAGPTPGTANINSNGVLNSNGFLTLKSDVNGTASIPAVASGGAINGNVNIERFIAGGLSNSIGSTPGRRAFRFIGHPFSTYTDLRQLTNKIDISGTGATASPTSALFTQTGSNAPSAFWFNPLLPNAGIDNPNGSDYGWVDFTNTLPSGASDANAWKVGEGLRVLVRGAKGEGLTGGNYTASNVTLNMSGPINIATSPLTINLHTNNANPNAGWNLIANPLPSTIEIQAKLKSLRESNTGGLNSNLTSIAYVWNPNKINTGKGGWDAIDLTQSSNYYLAMNGVIVVQTVLDNNHVLHFIESDKASNNPTQLFRTNNSINSIAINLQDSAGAVLDETFIRFNPLSSLDYETSDGGKMINQYALYSITRNNVHAFVNSFPQPTSIETKIHLGVHSTEPKQFTLTFPELNLINGLDFYLKDNLLKIEQPITTTSYTYTYNTTTDTATQGDNRFELLFRTNGVLPVTFTNIQAYQKESNIEVDWTTTNEQNIERYEVEKSRDGSSFNTIASVAATGNNNAVTNYSSLDKQPFIGNNYYRIKAFEKGGQVKYTNTVNVKMIGKNVFTISPNPIKNKTIVLQMDGVAKGEYVISVYNSIGQLITTKTVTHQGGSSTQQILLGNVSAGNYQVTITGNSIKNTQHIIVD